MLIEKRVLSSLSDEQERLWNEFHDHCSQSHPLQTPWILKCKKSSLQTERLFFEGFKEEQSLSATAIMQVFVHPLFGARHGVIFRGPTLARMEDLEDFVPFIAQEARKRGLFALRVAPYFESPRASMAEQRLQELGFSLAPDNSGYVTTTVLDLNRSQEDLFSALHSKLRWRIRRAQKSNPVLRFLESEEDCRQAFEISQRLGRKKKFPTWSYDTLLAFVTHLKSHPHHGMAKGLFLDQRLVSFVVLLASNEQIWYEYGASDPEVQQEGRTHLLLWDAIVSAQQRGMKRFNLGGVETRNSGPGSVGGVSDFKLQFSGEPHSTTRDFYFVLRKFWFRCYSLMKRLQMLKKS